MQTATSPRPAAFWDRIAKKYAAQPVADPTAYEEKLKRVRSLLRAEDRVLEIGCGTGTTALHLAPRVAEYVGADISLAMLEIATQKIAELKDDRLRFIHADAAEPVDGAPFDVVMAFSLLHLVDDLPAALAAAHDQVKPGGLFISKTVCLGDANIAIRLFVRCLRLLRIAPPVRFVAGSELRHLLVRAGFEILEQRFLGKSRLNPFIVARRPT